MSQTWFPNPFLQKKTAFRARRRLSSVIQMPDRLVSQNCQKLLGAFHVTSGRRGASGAGFLGTSIGAERDRDKSQSDKDVFHMMDVRLVYWEGLSNSLKNSKLLENQRIFRDPKPSGRTV